MTGPATARRSRAGGSYLGRWLDAAQPVPSATATPSVKVFFCGTGCVRQDARQGWPTRTRATTAAARTRGLGEIPIEVREGAPGNLMNHDTRPHHTLRVACR